MARFTATLDSNLVPRQGTANLTLTIFEEGDAAVLTDHTVVFEVKSSAGETVIQKVSTDSSQISIASNVCTVKFVGGDTEDYGAGGVYYCDAWVYDDDDVPYQCLERQRFRIGATVHEPDNTPPGPPAGIPLRQSNVWRRFIHTWSPTGTSDTVTIPETGMLNNTYVVHATFTNLNGGGAAFLIAHTLTTTTFVLEASGTVTNGAQIMITLEDM